MIKKGEYMTEAEKRTRRCCFTGHRPEKMAMSESQAVKELEIAIRQAIEATKDLQVATAKITMDPSNHNPIKEAVIIENKDGKYELKAKIAPEK